MYGIVSGINLWVYEFPNSYVLEVLDLMPRKNAIPATNSLNVRYSLTDSR